MAGTIIAKLYFQNFNGYVNKTMGIEEKTPEATGNHNITHVDINYYIGDDYYITDEGHPIWSQFNEDDKIYLRKMLTVLSVTKILAVILSVIACLIAFVSWIMISKWRTFINFVYLNLISSYTLGYIVPFTLCLGISGDIFLPVVCVVWCSFLYWLLIASLNMYKDIVKVFHVNITWKRIKSFVFVWTMSLLNTLLVHIASIAKANHSWLMYIYPSIIAPLTLICDCFIYCRVLYSLFYITECIDMAAYKQKLQVATLTFLTSGFLLTPVIIVHILSILHLDLLTYSFCAGCGVIIVNIQIIIINICFLLLKSNRRLWRIFFCHRTENISV